MHQESLRHHITHLEDSHAKLEKQLTVVGKMHGNDTAEAHEIKKKKLHIKDEIERCKRKLSEMN